MNVSNVPTGWKVYALTWTWLGIAGGLASESALATFIVWAIGASAGWLLAPTVRHKGWIVVASYFTGAVVTTVVVVMCVGWLIQPAKPRSGMRFATDEQIKQHQDRQAELLRSCILGVNEGLFLGDVTNPEVAKQKALDACSKTYGGHSPYIGEVRTKGSETRKWNGTRWMPEPRP